MIILFCVQQQWCRRCRVCTKLFLKPMVFYFQTFLFGNSTCLDSHHIWVIISASNYHIGKILQQQQGWGEFLYIPYTAYTTTTKRKQTALIIVCQESRFYIPFFSKQNSLRVVVFFLKNLPDIVLDMVIISASNYHIGKIQQQQQGWAEFLYIPYTPYTQKVLGNFSVLTIFSLFLRYDDVITHHKKSAPIVTRGC